MKSQSRDPSVTIGAQRTSVGSHFRESHWRLKNFLISRRPTPRPVLAIILFSMSALPDGDQAATHPAPRSRRLTWAEMDCRNSQLMTKQVGSPWLLSRNYGRPVTTRQLQNIFHAFAQRLLTIKNWEASNRTWNVIIARAQWVWSTHNKIKCGINCKFSPSLPKYYQQDTEQVEQGPSNQFPKNDKIQNTTDMYKVTRKLIGVRIDEDLLEYIPEDLSGHPSHHCKCGGLQLMLVSDNIKHREHNHGSWRRKNVKVDGHSVTHLALFTQFPHFNSSRTRGPMHGAECGVPFSIWRTISTKHILATLRREDRYFKRHDIRSIQFAICKYSAALGAAERDIAQRIAALDYQAAHVRLGNYSYALSHATRVGELDMLTWNYTPELLLRQLMWTN